MLGSSPDKRKAPWNAAACVQSDGRITPDIYSVPTAIINDNDLSASTEMASCSIQNTTNYPICEYGATYSVVLN